MKPDDQMTVEEWALLLWRLIANAKAEEELLDVQQIIRRIQIAERAKIWKEPELTGAIQEAFEQGAKAQREADIDARNCGKLISSQPLVKFEEKGKHDEKAG